MPGQSRRRVSSFAVDVRPLRDSPAFRRLWAGMFVSTFGRQITVVAVPYQIFSLTGSSFWVGMAGLVQAVPLLTVAVLAGPVLDRLDRRRVLLTTQCLLALTSAGLAVNALAAQRANLVAIYVLVGCSAAVSALDSPTRTAIIPNLVSREQLVGALSLNFGMFQVALIGGPALAGLILGRSGLTAAYVTDVVTFAAAILAVALLPPQRIEASEEAPDRGIAAIRAGFGFIRRQPLILGGFAMDLFAMIFGLPRALFPALAATRFASWHAIGLGLLFAAPGAGAVLAILAGGWIGHIRHQGRVIIFSVAVWGFAIIGFGLSTALVPALLLLALAGAADSYSGVARNTTMQTLTPDHLRGRLSAVYYTVVVGGPYLGDLEAGGIAALTSVPFSVITGGIGCLIGVAIVSARFPALWTYNARIHEHEGRG